MKALIVGATSRIASWAVDELSKDSDVELTLFVRNKAKLANDLQYEKIVVGDATKAEDLIPAMEGQDVVYASLGGDVVAAAKAIVQAMEQTGVKRLIWTSSLGIYDEVPGEFGKLNMRALPGYLQTYRQAADIVTDSGLDYTIIRPGWLTNEDKVDYELTYHNEPFKGTEVSRKSVAAYAAHLIKHPSEDVKDSVGVDKPGSDGDRPRAAVMKLNGFDPNM